MGRLLLTSVLLTSYLYGQTDEQLNAEGKLIIVELVPGEKKLEVLVVGYPAAELKFNDLGEAFASIGGKKAQAKVDVFKFKSLQ